MTIQQIKNERRRTLREYKPIMRRIDTAVEALERELVRILSRKRAVPEKADLERLTSLNNQIRVEQQAVSAALKKGFIN